MQSYFAKSTSNFLKVLCLVSLCIITIPSILGFTEFIDKILVAKPSSENSILLGMGLTSLFLSLMVAESLQIFKLFESRKFYKNGMIEDVSRTNKQQTFLIVIYFFLTIGSLFILGYSLCGQIFFRSLYSTWWLIFSFMANFLVLIFYRRNDNYIESARNGLLKVWSIVLASGIIFALSAIKIIDLGFESSRFLLVTGLTFSIFLVYFEVYFKELRVAGELKEKEKQKSMLDSISRISQMVAHDIMRPFTALRLSLRMMQSRDDKQQIDPRFVNMLKDIDAMSNSVKRMLDDLLFFGSKGELELNYLDFPEIVSNAKGITIDDSIKFRTSFSHKQAVMGDALQIERVFQNLFANAVKIMNRHGMIDVTTSDIINERMVAIKIGNDGPSIDLSIAKDLFLPFVTGEQDNNKGLGLAICANIVEKHNGTIRFDHDKNGRTIVVLALPAVGRDRID